MDQTTLKNDIASRERSAERRRASASISIYAARLLQRLHPPEKLEPALPIDVFAGTTRNFLCGLNGPTAVIDNIGKRRGGLLRFRATDNDESATLLSAVEDCPYREHDSMTGSWGWKMGIDG